VKAKDRTPFSPAEFDAVCRKLWKVHPYLSETSGRRSFEHNAAVDGQPESKHMRIGMGRDFAAPTVHDMKKAEKTAKKFGLWADVHRVAKQGWCLHVQGLPVGPIAKWWLDKYGEE